MSSILRCVLVCLLLLCATAAQADEWNDSFDSPRPYRVLRDIAVRAGPGNSHKRLGSMNEGDVIRVSQIVNGWHLFVYDGSNGWIFKRYLRPMAAGEAFETAKKPMASKDSQAAADPVQEALEELKVDKQAPLAHVLQENEPTSSQSQAVEPAEAGKSEPEVLEPEVAEEETPPLEEPAAPVLPEEAPPIEEPVEPAAPAEEFSQNTQQELAALPAEESKPRRPLKALEAADVADCERFVSLQPGVESGKASFQGTLQPGARACFRILALEDWAMEVTLEATDNAARFDVFSPTEGRLVSSMKAWAHSVELSGDKQIVVYGPQEGAPLRYTLGVQIR